MIETTNTKVSKLNIGFYLIILILIETIQFQHVYRFIGACKINIRMLTVSIGCQLEYRTFSGQHFRLNKTIER